MAEDVKNSLLSRLKITKFSMQMDESTDVSGLAILFVFVRYPYQESFDEDLLLCKPLPTTTTGAEIFMLIDDYFTENSVPWDNCILHRYALAMKKLPPALKDVKIINFIKSRPKNIRLFKALCDEMGSDYSALLLHTEVRWLSRGRALTRLFELRAEVRTFLKDN